MNVFFSRARKEINRYGGATRKKISILESTMALFIDGSEEKTSRWVRCVACLDTAFAFVEAASEPTSYILPRLSVMQETFVFFGPITICSSSQGWMVLISKYFSTVKNSKVI